ncbi:hypothetical protein [Flavobacterium sp. ENC]|uniref:hypothetical protein n=1 Tax=Flavobacterium sp. ENC TaxID=2897330 RepID=UPI001E4A471E|nr:hypothetical protein [Flavobacterium sp. ENC]MCD0464931.1 hypothetical protein [Flavobacterium sp. ENC]
MCNNTFFEYYRKAIKEKYEIERKGDYSNNLNPPTVANLRNLCMKRFRSDTITIDDLNTFKSFFEFEFDGLKRNLITGRDLNKFRAIGDFFRGETIQPLEDTIHFSAILLDFQPRPFKKFKKVMDGKSEDEIMKELKLNNDYTNEEENIDEVDNKNGETIKELDKDIFNSQGQNLLAVNKYPKSTFFEILLKKSKNETARFVGVILLFTTIYFTFLKKDYMQWSKDHYEVVSNEGIEGNPNEIIQYDKHLLDFKKIPVCDTTTWFVNGKSIVWYAKTDNEVDFFTTCGNGRHPVSGSTTKPVTYYIFDKYKKPCSLK